MTIIFTCNPPLPSTSSAFQQGENPIPLFWLIVLINNPNSITNEGMMKIRVPALFLFSLILFATQAFAQAQKVDDIFQWKISAGMEDINGISENVIYADLTIAPEHIVYKDMTSLSVQVPDGVVAPGAIFPPSHEKEDPIDGTMKQVYDGTVRFIIPVRLYAAEPGVKDVTVQVRYQGCSKTLCYLPTKRSYPFKLGLLPSEDQPRSKFWSKNNIGPQEAGDTPLEIQNATGVSTTTDSRPIGQSNTYSFSFTTLFLIFLAGLGTTLTPCVYPLIPITVTIFGARDTKNKLEAFSLAAMYVFGIALMFSGLGLLAASTGMIFGQFMSNPFVIGAIALLFVIMGASMLGAFDLQIPAAWQSKLIQVGGKGYGSAFMMGLAAGVVAAPCTGPVLAGILAWIAQHGNPAEGFAMLFTYAIGLGLPFLILGTFSGLIQHMPKSGGWMESVKSVFGIILLAVALYYLKDAYKFLRAPLEHSAETYTLASVMLVIGVALGAVHLSFHNPDLVVRMRKGIGVFLCVFGLYIAAGSLTQVEASAVNWNYELEQGLALAKTEKRPVMIDFYADWCAACKELDAFTYSNPQVGQALEKFVNIKVDLTDLNAANEKIQERFGIPGLPVVEFYNSQGEVLPHKRLTGFVNAEDFLKHIQDVQ